MEGIEWNRTGVAGAVTKGCTIYSRGYVPRVSKASKEKEKKTQELVIFFLLIGSIHGATYVTLPSLLSAAKYDDECNSSSCFFLLTVWRVEASLNGGDAPRVNLASSPANTPSAHWCYIAQGYVKRKKAFRYVPRYKTRNHLPISFLSQITFTQVTQTKMFLFSICKLLLEFSVKAFLLAFAERMNFF